MPFVYILVGAVLCVAAFIGTSVGIIKLLERHYAKRLAALRSSDTSSDVYQARDQANASYGPNFLGEADSVSERIQVSRASYIATSELDAAMTQLGAALPTVIRHQAMHSRRSEADIVYDLYDRIVEAINVNWRRTTELRVEQASDDIGEVWVAAYPFLDHIRRENGGMYETVRDNLRKGTRYVYFQPDRKYFDILHHMLTADPDFSQASSSLSDGGVTAPLRFIEARSDLLKATTFSIWNPKESRRMEVFALPNHQNPIHIEEHNGIWQVRPAVTMFEVRDRAQAELFYEHLEPLYRQATDESGQKEGRRNAGA